MSDLLKSLAASASGMEAQALRLRVVSENIANADTPGYQRKVVSFRDTLEDGQLGQGTIGLDRSSPVLIYDPGHPLADESGHYDGANVDLVIEIADAREAQRSYEANLKMFDQTRQMAQGLLELLRR